MFRNVKIFKLSFLFLYFSFHLFAGFENYLKKIEGKSDIHKIKNIDFIYMINLDERPEKFEKSCRKLHFYDIYPYRFSAINGWNLSLEAIDEIGLKYKKGMKKFLVSFYSLNGNKEIEDEIFGTVQNRGYFSHRLGLGAIGCILSHLSVLQDAYDSGYKTIWIMEDDIDIIRNPHLISIMIKKLDIIVGKTRWDILFTDIDTKNTKGEYVPCFSYAEKPNFTPKNPERFKIKQNVGKDFIKTRARYGSYSMIIRRSGIKKLLNFYKTYGPFLPHDMEYILPDDINMFTVRKDIISHEVGAPSDNGFPPPSLKY